MRGRVTSYASETSADAGEYRGLNQEMVTEEGRVSIGMSATKRVCKKEREEDERKHLSCRSWCDICVKARGRRLAHRSRSQRGDKDIGTVPRISIDYFYMNEKDQRDGSNPLLIVMDESTGEKYDRQVERKGVGDDGTMDWLAKFNFDDKIVVDDASCAPAQGSIVTPRRLRIMHNFLEKHGCADGFAGCRYKRSGLVGSRDHTQT